MDNKTHYHNRGQSERGEGKPYSKPHGVFDELTTWSTDRMQQHTADNDAYDKGWDHTDEQLKNAE